MIDTTQLDVLEAALKLIGGRPIINSINLEDGEGKFDKIAYLAREYGAALVALTIDEVGMAKDAAGRSSPSPSACATSWSTATACSRPTSCSTR
jgi:cobalamin-dependent methionine synthase I